MLARQPLSLVTNNELNIQVLFEERTQHQTKTTAKAVRQRGHGASDNIVKPLSDKPTLREALIKRLANIVPTNEKLNATTGVLINSLVNTLIKQVKSSKHTSRNNLVSTHTSEPEDGGSSESDREILIADK